MTRVTRVTRMLPRSRPSDQGVPAAAVEAVLDALADAGLELHSLMVLRHGHVVAEGWWAPYSSDRVHLLYSLSKSFTSTAVGLAVAEGRFALADRVVDLLPERVPDDVDPRVASLTVHHLLSMSTGHREDTLERAATLEPTDLARGFLRIPPEEAVGSRHAYNNTTTYLLAAIVEKHCGMPLLDYLQPRLFEPLGIEQARWDTDRGGRTLGFSGLHLQTESIAAFGQLLLQDGVWRGERVLPEGWVALATRGHIDNDNDPAGPLDWRQGYGYQYWMSRHGFRGDGAFGQFCVVVPEADLVVATTACVVDMQAVLDVLWTQLLPALGEPQAGDAHVAAGRALADRLAALALPAVGDDRHPVVAGRREEARFQVVDAGFDAPFDDGASVTVTPETAGWTLHIETPSGVAVLPVRADQWCEGSFGSGQPVVTRGGWTSTETFEADVALIETPHRIRLRCNGVEARAAWNQVPLTRPRLVVRHAT